MRTRQDVLAVTLVLLLSSALWAQDADDGGDGGDTAGKIRDEVGGAGEYAVAYLAKEAFASVTTGDSERARQAFSDLSSGGFWADYGVWTTAAKATGFGISKLPLTPLTFRISNRVLPLAAGVLSIQALRGRLSLTDLTVATGSFLAADMAVTALFDGALLPWMGGAPSAWPAVAGIAILKTALTLYAGEAIDVWIHDLLDGDTLQDPFNGRPPREGQRGVEPRIGEIGKGR